MVFFPRERNVASLNLRVSDYPTMSALALYTLVTKIRQVERIVAANRIVADNEKCNINIKIGGNHLRLIMLKENLYVIGYKNNLEGVWELMPAGIDNLNRVNGSTALGFEVNYFGIEGMSHSFESFVNAVKTLIKTENPHQNVGTIRSCVFRIIITIIESSRFGWIMDSFLSLFGKKVAVDLSWLPTLIRNWKVLTLVANQCEEDNVVLCDKEELPFKLARDIIELFENPRLAKDCIKAPWIRFNVQG